MLGLAFPGQGAGTEGLPSRCAPDPTHQLHELALPQASGLCGAPTPAVEMHLWEIRGDFTLGSDVYNQVRK